ncbi:MAG: hypothetical protein V7K71_19055 [Nostoc sp.]|uniref:hypothetical protein n=1 Tax=Nostoc sp. TaxID=1180 RepID=UPI002FF97789
MPDSYDLTQLDPNTFEHLVNNLALRALGLGLTGFSPGSDGGRDGYFEGDDENLRLLRRRLGRGAILAARLLQEGVLEQDKRIRKQFRKCLEPLAASLEIELLYPLIQVSQPNSQSWLYSFLISCLHDNNLTESVGAALVLVHILPDNHEKVEEVEIFLLASPSDYISCVLTSTLLSRNAGMRRQSITVKRWLLKTVVKIILSLKWASLTNEAFKSCIEILSWNIEDSFSIAKELNLSSIQINIFQAFFKLKYSLSPNNINNKYKYYFGAEVFHNPLNLIENISEFNLLDDFDNTPKLLQLIYLIARYSKEKQHSTLSDIRSCFSGKGEHLFNTFLSMLGLSILINNPNSLTKENQYLNNISYQYFEELSENKQIELSFVQRPDIMFKQIRKKLSLDLWKNLGDDYTFAAIFLWQNKEIFNANEIVNTIIDKVIENPKIISGYPAIWGQLIKEMPEREHELRRALLIASLEIICEDTLLFNFSPFELNLPLEAPLLPHIISSLLNLLIRHKNAFRSKGVDEQLEDTSKIISEMVKEASSLSEISKNLTLASSIRSAAMIAFLLHRDGTRDFTSLKQQIVEFYNLEVGTWYIKAITSCLCLLT